MTKERIRGWYDEYDGNVYVSFSGGKDSTVLVDIIDDMGYKDIPLVFVDTGLEYPEIREFVRSYGDRVTWLKPKMNFRQVIDKYGYPFISKEVSDCVQGARKYLTSILNEQKSLTDRQTDRQTDRPYHYWYDRVTGQGRYKKKGNIPSVDQQSLINPSRGGTITSIENSEELQNIAMQGNARIKMIMGAYPSRSGGAEKGGRSSYSQEKYKFFLDAPFEISNKCCNVMKKEPAHRYAKETGRKPITAQMASESRLRTQKWLQNGCNAFEAKNPISNPMSFWTEQDVLLYIKEKNLPICSVYGDIVEDRTGTDEVEGQMTISDLKGYEDMELFDAKRLPLKTTGCNRTGCMFCGFGCHLEKESRFERMKETHPQIYDYVFRPKEQGGLGYKEIIEWINEHGNMNIRF